MSLEELARELKDLGPDDLRDLLKKLGPEVSAAFLRKLGPFVDALAKITEGALLRELNEATIQCSTAVRDLGRPASLTLTIAMKPASKKCALIVIAEGTVKTKLPEQERGVTIFYVDELGLLLRSDPRQQRLPLRQVEIPAVAIDQEVE